MLKNIIKSPPLLFRLCYNKYMDQDKVNPFSGNPDISVGNTPVSQSSPAGVAQPGLVNTTSSANISSPAAQPGSTGISNSAAQPSPAQIPVNPYAPAGAPYAPGSNTPPPDYAMPITNSPISGFSGSALGEDNAPAVPNTAPHFSAPDSAYTSISPAPSQGQDIFLPSDSPEKPKLFTKKFIIIASISLVLIAAAVITGIILNNRDTSSGSTSLSDNSGTLGVYMNYILYGKESNSKITEQYDNNQIYAALKALDANSLNKNFINTAKQKWKNFTDSYDFSNDSWMETSIENYTSLVEFFVRYSEKPPLTSSAIKQLIYDNASSREYFENYYQSYNPNNLAIISGYIETLVDYDLKNANYYEVYKKYECLTADNLDINCVFRQSIPQEEYNDAISYLQEISTVQNAYNAITNSFIQNAYTIYNYVNGDKNNSQSVEESGAKL